MGKGFAVFHISTYPYIINPVCGAIFSASHVTRKKMCP
jgi:hypothetical protein